MGSGLAALALVVWLVIFLLLLHEAAACVQFYRRHAPNVWRRAEEPVCVHLLCANDPSRHGDFFSYK